VITHFKKMSNCKEEINDFYAACAGGLKEKIGMYFIPISTQFQFHIGAIAIDHDAAQAGFSECCRIQTS
jgi:uncharacterized protein YecE (DUF72 family)